MEVIRSALSIDGNRPSHPLSRSRQADIGFCQGSSLTEISSSSALMISPRDGEIIEQKTAQGRSRQFDTDNYGNDGVAPQFRLCLELIRRRSCVPNSH